VWALGNIAGDSPKCRDLVLESNALVPLLSQLKDDSKISMLRNATWTLSNFCRGKPQPPFEQARCGQPGGPCPHTLPRLLVESWEPAAAKWTRLPPVPSRRNGGVPSRRCALRAGCELKAAALPAVRLWLWSMPQQVGRHAVLRSICQRGAGQALSSACVSALLLPFAAHMQLAV